MAVRTSRSSHSPSDPPATTADPMFARRVVSGLPIRAGVRSMSDARPMTRFIQYPFDKTKMAEVRAWVNEEKSIKDLRTISGVKDFEISFCPGEGWLAARYIFNDLEDMKKCARPLRACLHMHRTIFSRFKLFSSLSHTRARACEQIPRRPQICAGQSRRACSSGLRFEPRATGVQGLLPAGGVIQSGRGPTCELGSRESVTIARAAAAQDALESVPSSMNMLLVWMWSRPRFGLRIMT